MPEMYFNVRWPDGTEECCYSPSLVIKDYLTPGKSYDVKEFRALTRTALEIASDRVKAKFGVPCRHAITQLAEIEANCATHESLAGATVTVIDFQDVQAEAPSCPVPTPIKS